MVSTVALDAGHGGPDRGVVSPLGLDETTLTLELAMLLAERGTRAFPAQEFVLLRQHDEHDPSLAERAQIAKEEHAGLVLSLHANASRNHDQRGGLALYWPENKLGYRVAAQAHRSLPVAPTRFEPYPAGVSDFPRARRVIGSYECTCVLVEVCYLDREDEARRMARWECIEATAFALLSAIAVWREYSR